MKYIQKLLIFQLEQPMRVVARDFNINLLIACVIMHMGTTRVKIPANKENDQTFKHRYLKVCIKSALVNTVEQFDPSIDQRL